MGGRGGAGGATGGLKSKLPGPLSFDLEKYDFPNLSGTEKQIKWAESIRESVLMELWDYATNKNADGKSTHGIADIYLKGKDAMEKDIRSNPLVKGTSGSLKEEKISHAISAFTETKMRIERWHELAEKKGASYWIENRTNALQNHLNKKLKRYIDGK
jgi:hypothetical protein|nr:MAG TPA_asm: hypothetical protein [Caudoviricetes sp.]